MITFKMAVSEKGRTRQGPEIGPDSSGVVTVAAHCVSDTCWC